MRFVTVVLGLGLAMGACTTPPATGPAGEAAAPAGRTVAVGTVSGGNGDSIATAIRFDGATASANGVPAEYEYIRRYLPGWRSEGQSLVEGGGRSYDRLSLVNGRGQRREIWFDVTDWIGLGKLAPGSAPPMSAPLEKVNEAGLLDAFMVMVLSGNDEEAINILISVGETREEAVRTVGGVKAFMRAQAGACPDAPQSGGTVVACVQ